MKKVLFAIVALLALSANAFAAEVEKEDVKADLKEVMTLELQIEAPSFR